MFEYIAGGAAILTGIWFSSKIAEPFIRPRLSKVKGFLGERAVKNILKKFHKSGGASLNDLLIPSTSTETDQVDHVLVTRHGIFVVETKNYSGFIEGSEKDPRWRQTIPGRNPISYEKYNPLMQNQPHIDSLRELIKGHGYIPYYNIVAFSDDCKILSPIPNVVNFKYLEPAIKARCTGEPVLSEEEVKEIKEILIQANITDKEARRQHDTKASLSADSFHNNDPEAIHAMYEEGRKAPILSFGPKPKPKQPLDPQQARLAEDSAMLTIKGKTASIEDFFEDAKRDVNGNHVAKGANFDHFICPYTGDSLPVKEAKGFYDGLWISYFKNNPDLEEYLFKNKNRVLGTSYNSQRLFAAYVKDKEGFIEQGRKSLLYQNIVQNNRTTSVQPKRSKPLDVQIRAVQANHGTQSKGEPSQNPVHQEHSH